MPPYGKYIIWRRSFIFAYFYLHFGNDVIQYTRHIFLFNIFVNCGLRYEKGVGYFDNIP